ncbi:hypothetical protein [Methylobacterium sp. CM6247]
MHSAANLTSPMLDALVKHAERRTGSRMLAYDKVARSIGATSSWVRKFLGNQPVRLDADTFLRIHATYQANCDRWDAQADEDRAAFFALGREDDGMDQGTNPSLHVGQGASATDGGRAAPVVAALVDQGTKRLTGGRS